MFTYLTKTSPAIYPIHLVIVFSAYNIFNTTLASIFRRNTHYNLLQR